MRMRAYDSGDLPDPDQVDLAVEVFRMLSDPTRVRILWTLLDAERPVNEIVQVLGKPQSAVSQHLAKLRLAKLVLPRKHGAQVFYRVANDHVRQLVADALHHAEHAGPGVPAHHRGEAAVLAAREAW
jgi:ArsR family transcriptional regulator, zinc-responsive transcriptional repressor